MMTALNVKLDTPSYLDGVNFKKGTVYEYRFNADRSEMYIKIDNEWVRVIENDFEFYTLDPNEV